MLAGITEEAAQRLNLPISLVSIVLDRAQYFAAAHGLEGWLEEVQGTPIEWSFCKHVVRDGAAFVVSDATRHPRVQGNPFVEHDGVRCYAGVPLTTSRGHVIGSFCVIGYEGRAFSASEMETLRGFARVAVERIEQRAGRVPRARSSVE